MGVHNVQLYNAQNTNVFSEFEPRYRLYMQQVIAGFVAAGLTRDTTQPFRQDNQTVTENTYSPTVGAAGASFNIGDVFFEMIAAGLPNVYFRVRFVMGYFHSTTSTSAGFNMSIEFTQSLTKWNAAGEFVAPPYQTWFSRGASNTSTSSEDVSLRNYYFIGDGQNYLAFYLADNADMTQSGPMGYVFDRTATTSFVTDNNGIMSYYQGYQQGNVRVRHSTKMTFTGGHVNFTSIGLAAVIPGVSGIILPDYYYGQCLVAQPEVRTARNIIGVFTADAPNMSDFTVPGLGTFRALHAITAFDFAGQSNVVPAVRVPA